MPDPTGFHIFDAAIDGTNTIFALGNAGGGQYSVVVMNTSGTVLRTWSLPSTFPAGLGVSGTNPEFVAVGDPTHQRVVIYNNQGGQERTIGSAGTGKGQLSTVTDLSVDAAGNVYIADAVNQRLSMFNQAGSYQADWHDDIPGHVVATGGSDPNLFVTSFGANPYLFSVGTTSIDGNLETFDQARLPADAAPAGVSSDAAHDVYVSDTAFGSIVASTSSLDPIESWTNSLEFPAGSFVDSANNLYVINAPGGPGAPPGQPGDGISVFALSNTSNASVRPGVVRVVARTPSVPLLCRTRGNLFCNGTLTLIRGAKHIVRRTFSIRRDQHVQLHPALPRSLAKQLKRARRMTLVAEVRTRNRGRDRVERSNVTLQYVAHVCGNCGPRRR